MSRRCGLFALVRAGIAKGSSVLLLLACMTPSAQAQDLADFDYENLSFRGLGFFAGGIVPTRVDNTSVYGARLDLGYLGPGVRILPSVSYWSSQLKRSEVREFEESIAGLIASQTGLPAPVVDLGQIDWSDLVISLDGQIVWSIPFGLLSYLGLGGSAHILNGEGAAIANTFVEDLLDSVRAGFNVHGGLEYLAGKRLRIYGSSRYEILGDLQYLQLSVGGQIMFGASAPGEESGN